MPLHIRIPAVGNMLVLRAFRHDESEVKLPLISMFLDILTSNQQAEKKIRKGELYPMFLVHPQVIFYGMIISFTHQIVDHQITTFYTFLIHNNLQNKHLIQSALSPKTPITALISNSLTYSILLQKKDLTN
jgi:hypothetical protein